MTFEKWFNENKDSLYESHVKEIAREAWIQGLKEFGGTRERNPFKIKISDSHCEYEYPLEIGSKYSIDDVYTKICKAFGAQECDGKPVEE